MKSLGQVVPAGGRREITLVPMIERWVVEDERELEARCARFRIAKLALDRRNDVQDMVDAAGRAADEGSSAA
ncbi:hypothetical protein SAMN05421874_101385 [Nonomuraea maritima]|uniref:Uncharacterized protein n=2 Tax=Nonomuraea maritima TaxID=683260 RepID=A0A1G8SMY1_9ACTN|nr:hypothetical protein SAMN05421874_101385 [Nonomuraea maritima]